MGYGRRYVHRAFHSILVAGLFALHFAGSAPCAIAKACCQDSQRTWRKADVQSLRDTLFVSRIGEKSVAARIPIVTPQLQDAAESIRHRRQVLIAFTADAGDTTLLALGVSAGRGLRTGVLLGAVLMLLLVALPLLGKQPWAVVLGQDNRYSASKFQIAIWFVVLIVSYGATLVLRISVGSFICGIDLPESVLVLFGLSVLSFVGAKAITQAKIDEAEAKAEAKAGDSTSGTTRSTPKPGAGRSQFPQDLLQNDLGRLDFGNLQMILITMLTAAVYCHRVFVCLGQVDIACGASLPDLDASLLAAFGFAQGAYLAKKVASRLGEG